MKQRNIEILVGFVVLATALAFLIFGYKIANLSKSNQGYNLFAKFENIEGIGVGSNVNLSGIKIGTVDTILLEDDTYYASIQLNINNDIDIPVDSRAVVSSSGLLGGKYIRIIPGASDDNLSDGKKIKFTQSALNLEELIGKLMYAITSK